MRNILVLTVLILTLVGCKDNKQITNNIGDIAVSHNIWEESVLHNKENENRAEVIGIELKQLPELDNVSVAITDNMAIIGITTKHELDDKQLISLKKKIKQIVKSVDGNILRVSVTSTPNLVEKVHNIADFVDDKEDIQDIKNFLDSDSENIIKNLTPIS